MLNGDYMELEAVSNSGPLIHLSQIGKFELLYIFSKIYIPEIVYKEVNIKGKPGAIELKSAKNIQVYEVSGDDIKNIKERVKDFKLDKGELQALSLCNKLKKEIFLTDDLDAREAGKSLGLQVHGSVGVIVRAYREKLVDLKEAEEILNALYEVSKLFITKAIIEEAIEGLRKPRPGL